VIAVMLSAFLTRRKYGVISLIGLLLGHTIYLSTFSFQFDDSRRDYLSTIATETDYGISDAGTLQESKSSNEKWRNKYSTGVMLDIDTLTKVSPLKQQSNELDLLVSSARPFHRPLHYHAMIVPMRDREEHLIEFQRLLNPYLAKNYNNSEFSLFIVEQDDHESFNKGWLVNVGIAEIIRHSPETECISMHDVDFAPDISSSKELIKGPVYYDKCSLPTGTASEMIRNNWTVPYLAYTGGVVTMHLQHWRAINGFSNQYISWGAEDDDLYLRLRKRDLLAVNKRRTHFIYRPPTGYGRFREIGQRGEIHHFTEYSDEKSGMNVERLRRMQDFPRRAEHDGLSDLQYKITSHKRRIDKKNGFAQIHHVKVKQQLLEFVHIPDIGRIGLDLEKAAAQIGIPWGKCHFASYRDNDFDCPANFEHLGLKSNLVDDQHLLWSIPYGEWNIDTMFEGKHLFIIVRNPFTYVISKFYKYNTEYSQHENGDSALNEFVHLMLCQDSKSQATIFQQHEYVFQNNTTPVKHVLPYENLTSSLPALFEQYDLPIDINLDILSHEYPLGIQNLTTHSIFLIHQYFAEDFHLLNYSTIHIEGESASISELCSET
jgi:hypothetical protein